MLGRVFARVGDYCPYGPADGWGGGSEIDEEEEDDECIEEEEDESIDNEARQAAGGAARRGQCETCGAGEGLEEDSYNPGTWYCPGCWEEYEADERDKGGGGRGQCETCGAGEGLEEDSDNKGTWYCLGCWEEYDKGIEEEDDEQEDEGGGGEDKDGAADTNLSERESEKRPRRDAAPPHKKKKRRKKRRGGFVPLSDAEICEDYGKGAVINGSMRTCLPDAVKMALYLYGGYEITWQTARAAMPCSVSDPSVKMANAFLKSYKLAFVPCMEYCSNPAKLFQRTDGVFLMELDVHSDADQSMHFAIYEAATSLISDNSKTTVKGNVEEHEKDGKNQTAGELLRRTFKMTKVMMINAYQLRAD